MAVTSNSSGQSNSLAEANRRCLECHGQAHLATLTAGDRAAMVSIAPGTEFDPDGPPRPGLFVEPSLLGQGLHARLSCEDCHGAIPSLPHAAALPAVRCGQCHPQAQVAFDRGSHSTSLARGDANAPTCMSCHGNHLIGPASERESATHKFNAVRTCSECHEQHMVAGMNGPVQDEHVALYLDSVHGRAVTDAGLVFSATCADCHGYHDVRPSTDPEAPTHREQIPETCGNCHLGVIESYAGSIHGQLLAAGDERAPVCTDCHAGHRITRATTPDHHLDIVAECGDCHEREEMKSGRRTSFYDTYRSSYHGQVTALGSLRAARCSDCHGAHDILPLNDPGSRLHGENLVETCASCHEGSTASFARYDPHADYRDGERYPLLHGVWLYFVILMSCAFGFFGLHSIFWLLRSLRERSVSVPEHHDRSAPGIRRFTLLNRWNHGIVIITFLGLVLTGIPLLFSDQPWAHRLAFVMGGVHGAGLWHRVFAVMLIINFALHAIGLIHTLRHGGSWPVRKYVLGPNTLLPKWRDFTDCAAMFRWFARGGPRPSFGRWTYWEKFDYWAEIGGTLIIGGSGLLLWFPEFFGSFLPGEVFNVAMIVHGYEALLALGFIFTIHFFNAHLRPEKFPVDPVIFTGQMPEAEHREERADEHAALAASGELETLRVPPPAPWLHGLALVVGAVAMVFGLTLVTLIVLAGLKVI